MHPRGWVGRGTGERGEPRARRGACPVGRLPTLPLLSFLPPIPQPPSPVGKGEILGYFMQGASPLASPGLNPGGTGEGGEPRARRGACPLQGGGRGHPGAQRRACPVGCPLTLPLACFSAPYPPNPLPRWGRGRFLLYFAGGYRPRHPCG